MKQLTLFLFMYLFLYSGIYAQQNKITIDGYIKNKDKEPLGFATVYVKELSLGIPADINGYFKFSAEKNETYTLWISYLNHLEKWISVTSQDQYPLNIVLDKQSYALDEIVVMADYKANRNSNTTINQQALEHIQPTSVADVLILAPGGLFTDSKITGFNRISIRQSGPDNNTSLGMGVVMDGIPLDNDGFRSQIHGLETTDGYADRLSLNRGIDLKTISTDHIQKIEIVKGISSAKLGNLSSGVIQTISKIGQTPLEVRLKADPLTKLVYVGKGIKLSPSLGFIHAGVDYTSANDDKRDPLSKFNRVTGQITYNNSFNISDRNLFIYAKLSEIYTLNQAKEDELTKEYNESFKNKYSRSGLALKAHLSDVNKFIDNIELISSLDYTYDLIERNRMVQLEAPLPSPLATVEGEFDGIFLPSQYYSFYQIENKPLAILNQLNFESLLETRSVNHKFAYGLEWKHTKNHGEGAIVDMTRPPYPGDSKYVRPRSNNSIPALSIGAFYFEDQITHSNKYFDFSLCAGLRMTKMFNLDSRYSQLNKVLIEPRINLSLAYNILLGNNKSLKNMFRLGFGQENKLPTLDFLYPDKVYKDLIVLNAYIKHNDTNNHLITNTKIYDVVNYDLRPNKNNKFELGWDIEYEDYSLFLTAFKEYSNRGYQSITQYNPVSFLRYIEPVGGEAITGRQPQKTDYIEERYNTFIDVPLVLNSVKVDKKGIEYRVIIPRIRSLATSIEVNGAYYNTHYTTSVPTQYHPVFKDENKPLPYVGIYSKGDISLKRIFNSNIWINTNIPKYKIVFTSLFQFIWLNDFKRLNGDAYPSAYISMDGAVHSTDGAIIQKIKDGDIIWRHYHLYKEPYHEKEPISLTVNLKVTKEFSHRLRASFFVNNILNINPEYKNRYQQNVRNWSKSFFGAEMTLSL